MEEIKQIYIIDDDPMAVFLLRQLITWNYDDFEVQLFEDADTLLASLEVLHKQGKALPELIFVDGDLEVFQDQASREQFCQRVDKFPSGIHLVFMTEFVEVEMQKVLRRKSVVKEVLVKPLTATVLSNILFPHPVCREEKRSLGRALFVG